VQHDTQGDSRSLHWEHTRTSPSCVNMSKTHAYGDEMELLSYESTGNSKLLFYCKLFTSVSNRLLVYLENNEWMNVLAGWGINQKLFLVLLLWNILKFVKRVVQMCIYMMYGYRQRQVCFSFFFPSCCESSYDKFHDCYTSHTPGLMCMLAAVFTFFGDGTCYRYKPLTGVAR